MQNHEDLRQTMNQILQEVRLIGETIQSLPSTASGHAYKVRLAKRSNDLSAMARDLYRKLDPVKYQEWSDRYFNKTGIRFQA